MTTSKSIKGRPPELDQSKVHKDMSASEVMETLNCSQSMAYTILKRIGGGRNTLTATLKSSDPETWTATKDGITFIAVPDNYHEVRVTTFNADGTEVDVGRKMRDAMRRAVYRAQKQAGVFKFGRCDCGNQGVVMRFNNSVCARCDAIETGQYSGRGRATHKTNRFMEEFGESPNAYVMHYSRTSAI